MTKAEMWVDMFKFLMTEKGVGLSDCADGADAFIKAYDVRFESPRRVIGQCSNCGEKAMLMQSKE